MEKTNFIIYGASGHAKVLIEALKSRVEEGVQLFVYDDDKEKKQCLGIPVEHNLQNLLPLENLVLGIGDNTIRKKLAEKLIDRVKFAPAIIHQTAVVSSSAAVQEGSVVFAAAVINAAAKIGKHCIINSAAVIEHDCILEDYVHISPNATLSGGVSVGEGTHIGSGATVIPGINIGKWCTIGAGAVVTKNLPDNCTAVGIPAKPLK